MAVSEEELDSGLGVGKPTKTTLILSDAYTPLQKNTDTEGNRCDP